MSKTNQPCRTQVRGDDGFLDLELAPGEWIAVSAADTVIQWYLDATWEIVDGCLVVFDRDTEAISSYAPTTWTHVVAVTIEADDQEGDA